MAAWASDYAQNDDAAAEGTVPYAIPNFEARHHEYISNQVNAYWRSVNASQHGFFNESFVDELAHAEGEDPWQFRRNHLKPGSRHLLVLDTVAQRSGWETPPPEGRARGIAMVESFGTIVAEVVEASLKEDGTPKVHKAWAVVDCGTTVNPLNAAAQIEGGLIMGLSAAIGEQITLDKGAVVESNFNDYPILKLADAPEVDVHFIESGAKMGGIGEPGLAACCTGAGQRTVCADRQAHPPAADTDAGESVGFAQNAAACAERQLGSRRDAGAGVPE